MSARVITLGFLVVFLVALISATSSTPVPPEDSEPPVHDCSSPPVTGPCKAAFSVFNYNASTGKCDTFTYGGCEGNGNRYDSEEECMKYCGSSSTSQSFSATSASANTVSTA